MKYLPILLFVVTVAALLFTSISTRKIVYYWAGVRTTDGISKRDKARSAFDPRTIMQIVVSLTILGCAVYIVLSRSYDPQEKHWAYGSAGTILGYWLKSK